MSDGHLNIEGLGKSFDGVKALDGFSCATQPAEILGLIGPNGAGKTTLFNVITGFLRPTSGSIQFRGGNLVGVSPHRIVQAGIARTFQNLRLIRRLSVLDNVLLAFQNQPGEKLRNVFFRPGICKRREAENTSVALGLLESVGLAAKKNDPADNLSYGQQKLLSILCCLATGAEILLLDEPIAGIAPQMIEQILGTISQLPKQGKSVILIEHNMDVIAQVCHRVIFMDAGTKVTEGTPREVRDDPRVIEAYLG